MKIPVSSSGLLFPVACLLSLVSCIPSNLLSLVSCFPSPIHPVFCVACPPRHRIQSRNPSKFPNHNLTLIKTYLSETHAFLPSPTCQLPCPNPISFLLSPVSCLLSPVSCLLFPVFCLSRHRRIQPRNPSKFTNHNLTLIETNLGGTAACLPSPACHLLCPESHLLYPVSCLLFPLSCLLSPVSSFLSPVFPLPSPDSYSLFPIPHPISVFQCLLSRVPHLCLLYRVSRLPFPVFQFAISCLLSPLISRLPHPVCIL